MVVQGKPRLALPVQVYVPQYPREKANMAHICVDRTFREPMVVVIRTPRE